MPRAPAQRKKLCAVCDMHKSECTRFKSKYVGNPLWCALLLDHSHHRIRRIAKRERAGAFERVITHDDVICKNCNEKHSSDAGVPRMKRSELVAIRAREDQRRLRLWLDVVRESGHLPRRSDPPVHVDGWYLDARDAAKKVNLWKWLDTLRTVDRSSRGGTSRLHRILHDGDQPEAQVLVEKLEEWFRPRREDQRRLKLYLDIVRKSGHLPRHLHPPVHVAGWYLDARDAAKKVDLAAWIDNLRKVDPRYHGGTSRLEMLRLHGTQPEAEALVEELQNLKKRMF